MAIYGMTFLQCVMAEILNQVQNDMSGNDRSVIWRLTGLRLQRN